MTYRPGMDARTAAFLRQQPGDPRIICDGPGCGLVRAINRTTALPPAWFLDGKAPPGWKLKRTRIEDGTVERVDLCPKCKSLDPGKLAPPPAR